MDKKKLNNKFIPYVNDEKLLIYYEKSDKQRNSLLCAE